MWKVEFSEKAAKQFAKLPRNIQQSIVKAIDEKLLVDPDFIFPGCRVIWEAFIDSGSATTGCCA